MNDYIFYLEKEFQAYLMDGFYTFIGPADQESLGDFTSVVNLVAPTGNNSARTINSALGNKNAVKQVLNTMYQDAALRVYVAEASLPHGVLYITIDEYCQRFNIQFRSMSS